MSLDPLNFMFAIITDETQARRAFAELRRRGLGEDEVFVLAGADGAAWIDSIGSRPAIVDPEEQRKQQARMAKDAAAEAEAGNEEAQTQSAEIPQATEAGESAAQHDGYGPGLWTRLLRALGVNPQPGGGGAAPVEQAWNDPDRYKHAAKEGHFVFAVRAPHPEDQDSVSKVLREHGGRFIKYYGRLNTTTFYK